MSLPVLFAHGAGASSQSDWMTAWAQRLGAVGPVTRFDYPYMAAGSRRPDRLPVLLDAHRDALADLHAPRVLLAGKSMGSRVGCHLAAATPEGIAGIVCFGYPLAAMGQRDKLRDQALLELRTPVLFLQGTRDTLCPLDLLDDVRKRMAAPSELHVVDTGDHSLQVTKTWCKQTGRSQDDVDQELLAAVLRFVEGL
jgi:predicted alpha/beta-hydrolase family hydrolase